LVGSSGNAADNSTSLREQVARRINTSVGYVAHLEAAKRHPSPKVVVKVAGALGLDARDLFLLANPKVGSLISEQVISVF
jgi:transcriptional regulator with XRE-family HTH domain